MYDIKLIAEINTFDYSLCLPVTNADTVRRSLDGSKFLVEGATMTEYTHSEIMAIMSTDEWTSQNPV